MEENKEELTFFDKLARAESKIKYNTHWIRSNIDDCLMIAETCHSLACDYFILVNTQYADATCAYTREYALNFLELKKANTSVTILDKEAKARAWEAENSRFSSEITMKNAKYIVDKWAEKVQMFKKIKGGGLA